jgi:hypothetical protein
LVCGGTATGCYLLRPERQFVNEIGVNKKALIVEAILTESCAPVRFRWRASSTFTLVEVSAGCSAKAEPKIGGSDWHVYYTTPLTLRCLEDRATRGFRHILTLDSDN